MRARVLLVTPPYHAGVVESAGRWPPLGLAYIAGALRAGGHEVEIYDAMSQDHTMEDIRREFRSRRFNIIGVTVKTPALYAAMEMLKAAKEENPGAVTVVGGVHPTFCYEDILREYPQVDYVVRWEGEETMKDLVDCLSCAPREATRAPEADIARVGGIAYRRDGRVVTTPPRPFLRPLDKLTPAWDLINWDDYCLHFMPGSRVATVSSSRGCVFECRFCSQQKFWQRKYRMRSPESFLAEVDLLHQRYGVDYFLLTDEYPTAHKERWREILRGLAERQLPIHLLIETCVVDILRDADVLDLYKDAGVLHIYVGVEGVRQDRLDQFKKNLKCEESLEAIRLINRAGMVSETSFILGVPEETPRTIKETLALAQYYDPDYAHFLMLAPWPFADIYDEMEPYIKTKDLSQYNLVQPVIKPTAMTREDLMAEAIDCYKRFYMSKLPKWFLMSPGLKRDYLLGSMKAMLDHSFLKKFHSGLGEMPQEVERYLSSGAG